MQLSVVVPTWSGTQALADMALKLLKQVRPMCDELLVGEDAGVYYKELDEIADRYFLHPENLGDVVNINFLLREAKGEFICSINSDIEIFEGSIRDLCIPGKLVGVGGPRFTGAFYCVPRTVLDEYGYPDEARQHAWKSGPLSQGADMEYAERCADILVLSDKIRGSHRTGWSYAEKRRLDLEAYWKYKEAHPNKEVSIDRHKARLAEDPAYKEMWGNED